MIIMPISQEGTIVNSNVLLLNIERTNFKF